jgi:uncharacterized protein YwqG
MISKLIIEEFIEAKGKNKTPVTKFGGQPDWLTEVQWPMSAGWDNRPMMFVAQIALDERLFKNGLYLYNTP